MMSIEPGPDDVALEAGDTSAGSGDAPAAEVGEGDATTEPSGDAGVAGDWPAAPFEDGTIGGDRPARVVLPSTYATDRLWPVVTLLHGYGANARVQDFYFGVSALADTLGAVVVLPDGTSNSEGAQFWNATNWCCDFESTGVDDAGYLIGLLDEVEASVPVDTSRVVFIGHSNGGFMSYRLACDHADRLTGIVSLAGLEFRDASRCDPAEPVTVLQIHGTADNIVAFEDSNLLPSAPETAARWAERNGCGDATEAGAIDFQLDIPGEETRTTTWGDCARGTGVGLWVIEEGTHAPGLSDGAILAALRFALDRPRVPAP